MEGNRLLRKEGPLVKLLDMVFIPTSLFRFTHDKIVDGTFKSKIYYGQALCAEVLRLMGYYELTKNIFS